jgi:hypothetical protein
MERIITTNILVSRVLAGRAFLVKTPACIEYYTRLKSWFSMGIQGAIVYGRPRLGKTSGSRWVLGAIQMVFGKIPYVEIPIRKQHLHNEGAFFQFMLKCCKHKYYNRGTVADKRDRLFEALLARARRSSIRMVILFIDEAQELEELHYQWLRNISNELDSAGYRIFCLLVGQKELIEKRKSLLVEGMEQIVSRFMTEVSMFSGLRNIGELRSVLNGFDLAVYPAENGRPFPGYFAPLAYAHGWRLEDLAEQIWSEYESCWNDLSIDFPIEVGMQYVTSTVTKILELASKRDKSAIEIKKNAIKECVKNSGFTASAQILYMSKKTPEKTPEKRGSK